MFSSISKYRGQAFDGASNMSGIRNGSISEKGRVKRALCPLPGSQPKSLHKICD